VTSRGHTILGLGKLLGIHGAVERKEWRPGEHGPVLAVLFKTVRFRKRRDTSEMPEVESVA